MLTASKQFFFFQAEDGIRDRDVTGVQTCALPISAGRRANRASEALIERPSGGMVYAQVSKTRSEERRVGKGSRSGWRRHNCEKTMEPRRPRHVESQYHHVPAAPAPLPHASKSSSD